MTSTKDQSEETQRYFDAYILGFGGRKQLEAQRDVADKMEEVEYRKATEGVEAELARNMLVLEAGGHLSLDMLQQVMLDNKTLKLKALDNDHRETRSKMQNHFDKLLLEHMEEVSRGIVDKLALVAKYNAPQLTAAQPNNGPSCPSQTVGGNTESRISIPNHCRPPPQSGPLHGGVHALYNPQLSSSSGQPKPHNEYSTPVGNHIPPGWTTAPQSGNPGDARALPSHQEILPSTPVLPQRVIEPSNTTSSGKRKLDTQVERQFRRGFQKRTRSFGAQDLIATDKAKPSTHRPSHKTRTIDFREVYQDGNAEHKHFIIQYPAGDDGKGDWWILKCEEHGVFFNMHPLVGAAQHLHSAQHNKMRGEHVLAIQQLGYKVWDCSKELADKNNEAVKTAFMEGYEPFNRNLLRKRRSTGFADSETIPVRITRIKRRKVALDSDDTESYHDSAESNVPESDDDMEMGNAEGGGASVSNKGLDVPSATATTEKQPADPPAASRDVSAAKTTAMASPGIKGSFENAGHDKDKGKEIVPGVIQVTEDAFVTVKEAADRVSSGRTGGGSAGRESESSSGAGFDTRKVVKIYAHSRSSKASVSASLAAATLAITGAAPPLVVAASRMSTPTVLRPDEAAQANRWRAVRSDSGPQVLVSPRPQKSGGSASAAGSATSALKEPFAEAPVPSVEIQGNVAATSRTSTPFSGKMGSEELFVISCYKTGSGGEFHKQKDGPFLRLVVDKQANICQTSTGQSVEVKINPHDIARVDVTSLDESRDASMVSLVLKDEAEGPKKQELVFERSKAMGRDEAGPVHARRFCGWIIRVNPLIDYRNQSHNSRRPARSYTRN